MWAFGLWLGCWSGGAGDSDMVGAEGVLVWWTLGLSPDLH
jgi:hypothetical protein